MVESKAVSRGQYLKGRGWGGMGGQITAIRRNSRWHNLKCFQEIGLVGFLFSVCVCFFFLSKEKMGGNGLEMTIRIKGES